MSKYGWIVLFDFTDGAMKAVDVAGPGDVTMTETLKLKDGE